MCIVLLCSRAGGEFTSRDFKLLRRVFWSIFLFSAEKIKLNIVCHHVLDYFHRGHRSSSSTVVVLVSPSWIIIALPPSLCNIIVANHHHHVPSSSTIINLDYRLSSSSRPRARIASATATSELLTVIDHWLRRPPCFVGCLCRQRCQTRGRYRCFCNPLTFRQRFLIAVGPWPLDIKPLSPTSG